MYVFMYLPMLMLISNAYKIITRKIPFFNLFIPLLSSASLCFMMIPLSHVFSRYQCATLLQPLLNLKETISLCCEAKSGTQLLGYVLLLVKQEAGVCLKLLF